ncbi:MAG: protein kinase [Planctomycetota bacterium]
MSQAQPKERGQQVEDLVAECLMRLEEGATTIPFEEICSDAPELIDDVRSAVEVAGGFQRLQKAGPGSDPLIGELLVERYRVSERIGSGAMGVVYGATDLELSRHVAIKVVHTKLLDRGKALARFEREAAALAAIRHEAVVTVYDRGITTDGSPFLVMERVDGVPCSDILEAARKRGGDDDSSWLTEKWGIANVAEPSYFRQAVQWAASLASGLEAAHAAGVYHRDVKPSNVMITREGKAILLDFGIAAKDDHATLTQTDAAVGTPVYMAPEALLGRTKAKPTQDVYSLAATLYHFLTFQAPYQGSSAEVLTALATREPVPAFKVRPGLPRDAQAILDHGLARNPAHRYQSAASMEIDLRAMLAFRPVSVRPTSTLVRAARRFRSSRVLLGAVAATVLITGVLGAGAWKESIAHRRRIAHQDAMSHVQAALGVMNPENRAVADPDLRAAEFRTLDQVVEAGHDPVVAHALRAAFRLDHGFVAGAQADMVAAAKVARTPYAEELAQRYQSLSNESSSALDLDLEEMPAAESTDDDYLRAFHLLRLLKRADAAKALQSDRLTDHRHAQELRLLCETPKLSTARRAGRWDEFTADAEAFVAEVEALEQQTGYRSAMTAHLLGLAYVRSGQFQNGLEMARLALSLSPASSGSALNAGHAARALGLLELAETCFQHGFRILPGYVKVQQGLAKVYAVAGDGDRARQLVADANFDQSAAGDRARAILGVRTEVGLAVAWNESDPEAAKDAAQRALQHCSMLPAVNTTRQIYEPYAASFMSAAGTELATEILKDVCREPSDLSVLLDLPDALPEDLNGEQTQLLKEWLKTYLNQLLQEHRALGVTNSYPLSGKPSSAR